jgi:hypothetical protein
MSIGVMKAARCGMVLGIFWGAGVRVFMYMVCMMYKKQGGMTFE